MGHRLSRLSRTFFATLLLSVCLSFFITPVLAQEDDNYPFASIAEAKRFQALTQQVRCVVCQGQSLAESNAPLARDLRAKIYHMIIAKKSDAEIKAFFVQRYGQWALLQPQFNRFTAFLWLFPWLGLALVACVLCRELKGKRI